MSTDRNNSLKPLKPALASNRTVRSPLTPRIAGNAPSPAQIARSSAAPRLPIARPPVASPRVKPQEDTPGSLNVTPRSSARQSRVGLSPSQEDMPSDLGLNRSLENGAVLRSNVTAGLGVRGNTPSQNVGSTGRSRDTAGNRMSTSTPSLRGAGFSDLTLPPGQPTVESRFFHASDMPRQEPAPKRPEPKKTPSFFYADGKEDNVVPSLKPSSPVLSAVSDKRSSGPWSRPGHNPTKSPPMLSPSLATTTSPTPFFPSGNTAQGHLRSPSPSKENIHLSYRKGASQIFGTRPTAPSMISTAQGLTQSPPDEQLRTSLTPSHRKSPSMSSIDSGVSRQSRRRSATALDPAAHGSPLTQEMKTAVQPLMTSPVVELLSIDTSLASPAVAGIPSTFSPTKHTSELAADARRERKVLDLEISNSSLLAINASLEREVRRQKAELKRFRRLSRAGRFSMTSNDFSSRKPTEMAILDDDRESEYDSTNAGDDQDEVSESEEGSFLGGGDKDSSHGSDSKEHDRLARDEKRLRLEFERHKEILVQSQSMNQSIKRCMYATEEMIREGKKALEYHVHVSDVKLGGRILTGHDDENFEVDDDSCTDLGDDSMESAKGLLDVWSRVGLPEGSEGSGDRDSGIEVERPLCFNSRQTQNQGISVSDGDSGRPPDDTIIGTISRFNGIPKDTKRDAGAMRLAASYDQK